MEKSWKKIAKTFNVYKENTLVLYYFGILSLEIQLDLFNIWKICQIMIKNGIRKNIH